MDPRPLKTCHCTLFSTVRVFILCQVDITEALFIVKWGGVLTQAGRKQAITLGKQFRRHVYGGEISLEI